MGNKINSVLKNVLEKISPSESEIKNINSKVGSFLDGLRKDGVEIFMGGSFAKNTVIKKDHYDVDVFVRFEEPEEDFSKKLEMVLKDIQNKKLVHGSRDYFRVKLDENLYIELIPVLKIKKPEKANNITDLSYSHVNYVNKKTKAKDLDEMRLAKAFCYANKCYGAESYIQGFSGYALELLIIHYGSFLKFIKGIVKINDKMVIDIEKHYKSKNAILMDMNGSKLNSPIILVDPTYKERNALAALSDETFEKFKGVCDNFLKNPSVEAFELEKTDLEKIKDDAEKKNYEYILIECKTDKQEGDVAGSKLLKFYKHLISEISDFFDVKSNGFNYNNENAARFYFVVKKKDEILVEGPDVKDDNNVKAFEKVHKNYFTKQGKIYAKETVDFSLKDFINNWKKKNAKKVKEMSIVELKVL